MIAGTPQEGVTLTAYATWTGDPAPSAAWAWLRCAQPTGPCDPIAGATSDAYPVAAADVGSVLRVRLTVTNPLASAQGESEPTAVVTAAPPPPPPPPPEPTPAPTPTPTSTATPTPTPQPQPKVVFDLPPKPIEIPAVEDGYVEASEPALLDPFPVVRIRGRLTATGARITLLTVRATRGALIVVQCRGSSCPLRRLARRASATRARPFERHLRAGTRLRVKVTRRGYIGKWTTIVIRLGVPPKRSDRCVYPGARSPVPCPTG